MAIDNIVDNKNISKININVSLNFIFVSNNVENSLDASKINIDSKSKNII